MSTECTTFMLVSVDTSWLPLKSFLCFGKGKIFSRIRFHFEVYPQARFLKVLKSPCFYLFFKKKIFWPKILKKQQMLNALKIFYELQFCTRTAKKISRGLRAREVPLSKILGGGKSRDSPCPPRELTVILSRYVKEWRPIHILFFFSEAT